MTDPFVRPDVRRFLDHINAQPGPRFHQMTPSAARQAYAAGKELVEPPLDTLGLMRDLVVPTAAGPLPARLFDARETRDAGPIVLFFHGGGFVFGSVATHASLCAEIARTLDLPVVSIDYRLAPEHRWPAATEDAEAAARWIAAAPPELGRTPTGLVLVGDSAGGMLAITTAMALRDTPAPLPVIAQGLIYPLVDSSADYPSFDLFAEGYSLTRASMMWFDEAYRAEPGDPRAAPVRAQLAGMPAAVVLTAGLDPLRDQGRAFAARLAEAGVPVVFREAAGTIHGFATLRRALPSAVDDMAGFLRALRTTIAEAEGAQ